MTMIQIWGIPREEFATPVGRFMITMNSAEAYIKQLFWKRAGISYELGARIMGEQSIHQTCEHLESLLSNEPSQAVRDDLLSITKELRELKEMRNKMAHRQWLDQGGDHVILSRRVLAKDADKIQEIPITAEELDVLCLRIYVICGRILRHLLAKEAIELIEGNFANQGVVLPRREWR